MATSSTELFPDPSEGLVHPPICKICGNLQGIQSQTLTFMLPQVSNSAKEGRKACSIIQESHAYARDLRQELSTDPDAEVNFQIPVVDDGCPMIIGISDSDGGYSFNEIYTISDSMKAPWSLVGQASERAKAPKKLSKS
jgi:hypothetical protein